MGLLEKLTNYKAKKALCYDIALAYEQRQGKALAEANQAAKDVPAKSVLQSEEEALAVMVAAAPVLILQQYAVDCSAEAAACRELANSKKLYFVRTTKLERVLKELPVRKKSQIIEAKLPCGTVGIEMKA